MKLGIQSFTILKDFREDFHGTMQKVSDMGLHYVEWLMFLNGTDYGLGNGMTPQEAVRVFDDYGLKLTGCIFGSKDSKDLLFNYDEVQKVIDWYAAAGCTAIGLANDYFVDEEFFKRRMDAYNELGRRCAAAGMSWTYHNHFHEQQMLGGKTVLDRMLDATDPDSVGLDWDIYWGVRGMLDPVPFIEKYGSRIKRFHCKDFPFARLDHVNGVKHLPQDELICWDNKGKYSAYNMVAPEDFTECGTGIIKWQDVVTAANKFEIPYMFVEQDYTTYPDKYQSLEASKQYLLGLQGLTVR